MSYPFETLLSPFMLTENVSLKNRIISPNVVRGHSQGPETWPADPQFSDCLELCASGAAMFSYRHYDTYGGGAKHHGPGDSRAGFDYSNPQTWNYIGQLAEMVHMTGSKILVKIEQAFPDGMSLHGGDASALFPTLEEFKKPGPPGMPPRPVPTLEEMKSRICPKERFPEVIGGIVALLKKYQYAGFDGMSIRGDRYIDASVNLREDEYGGPIENRARFTHELLSAIKTELGRDFIVEIAMPGCQTYGELGAQPHGYTLDEFITFAKLMEDVADVIQVRNENMTHYHPTSYDSVEHDHQSLTFCRAAKAAGVKIPLAANGGFIEAEEMEAALRAGDCDLISVGRELIAEPEFVRKLVAGEKPTPCIQCNRCHGMFFSLDLPYCSVNPTSGITHRLDYAFGPQISPKRKKKVAVIGGGLIGMRAAVMAAVKGHEVTLYEKTGYLGGKAKYADLYDFKWTIRRYRLWLVEELKAKGITVKMNCEPTREALLAEKYDAIIACTGSVEKKPPIPGADDPKVLTSEDIYESRILLEELGERVVMVGGSSVAMETAVYVAQQGHQVTVITRQDGVAKDSRNPHDGFNETFMKIDPEKGYGGMVSLWEYYGVKTILNAKTLAVTPDSVTYCSSDGTEETIQCDTVIVNGGYRHCTEAAFRYAGCAPEIYLAGDVENTGGDLQRGNVSAFGKVNLL
ncbi:MAG: FAD-dependent oxidoreductase [Oscillospiraceae bacterium]|nr:FAD-dependent oxidoreductase [Oscillospiraceae bacterium]